MRNYATANEQETVRSLSSWAPTPRSTSTASARWSARSHKRGDETIPRKTVRVLGEHPLRVLVSVEPISFAIFEIIFMFVLVLPVLLPLLLRCRRQQQLLSVQRLQIFLISASPP